jgi:hypothetical protein
MTVDFTKARRESLRWYLLLTLQKGGYLGCGEMILLTTINGVVPDATAREIRTELDYLEHRQLVEISHRDSPSWIAKLSRTGTDLVEYTVPCEPGIARPTQYWGER